MRSDIHVRLTVWRPPAGVTMKVQRGRDGLLPPSASSSPAAVVFDFVIAADMTGPDPNFLGEYAQGPKAGRFIYVNSGKRAQQKGVQWDRRAKISLMSITRAQIETVLKKSGSFLHAEFEGTGPDGGPTCASVKGIEWRVEQK